MSDFLPPRVQHPHSCHSWGLLLGIAASPLAVGTLSALFAGGATSTTRNSFGEMKRQKEYYESLPSFRGKPPANVFAPVWTVLYTLMGLSILLITLSITSDNVRPKLDTSSIEDHSQNHTLLTRALKSNPLFRFAVGLFVVQLVLNFSWSIAFFRKRDTKLAMKIIVALDVFVFATIASFWKINKTASFLLTPYVVWILYATYLNWKILKLSIPSSC